MKKFCLSVFVSLLLMTTYAQNTFNHVHQILQTKCSNATCHSATSADVLKFDGNVDAVYTALINKDPLNSFAKDANNKLVKVNQPYESYLLRKINYDFDRSLALGAGEGDSMVDVNGQPLSKKETELIRQWIMNGAKKTGKGADTALINAYYDDPTYPFLQKPMAPPAGKGMQLRCGPIFLPKSGSGQEFEILLKHHLQLPYDAAITKIDGFMNNESHHFLLFKFDDSLAAAKQPNGIRVVTLTGGQVTTSFDGDKGLTGAWQRPEELDLPAGTALYWDKNTWLDLNYHVKNYGAQAVLPCDFYFNIYFEPRDPKIIEMKSQLVNRVTLMVPPGTSTHYHNDPTNGKNEVRHLWMLSSHTHKYGVGFDLFELDKSKPNQLGNMIYDGFMNYQGVPFPYSLGKYEWDHAPIRYYSPLHTIDFKTSGIRAKTVYDNTSNQTVFFGFTTDDEMQLFYYMYTSQLPGGTVGINEIDNISGVAVYPNPVSFESAVYVDRKTTASTRIELMDVSGKKVAELFNGEMQEGSNRFELPSNLSKGVYFVNVTSEGSNISRKFIVAD